MPEKSEAEKKSDVAQEKAKPREPDPMVPPVTPAVVAQKVAEGSRFWVWLGVPICVDYDEIQKLNRMGRVAVEKYISDLLAAQIHAPRKAKGKDSWAVKVEYPADCKVIANTCEAAVGQIRQAMSE